MLYRFTKKIHKITAFAGILLLFFTAATDERFSEIGQMPPESLGTVFAWGLALMIPTAIYLILEYIRGKKNGLYR